MIKHLSGDYETVEYDSKRSILLYDNDDNEAYPVHWHNAVEILMPMKNYYTVKVGGTDYTIKENEVLIVPPGELHSMPAIPGRRLIFQCDNSVLGDVSALEPVMRSLTAPLLITPEFDKELHVLAKKTMLDIYAMYGTKSELADVRIYSMLIQLLIAVREFHLEQSKSSLSCDDGKIDEYSEKFSTVMKYIDANYMYDIPLDQLADVAGYSKYHFSRIFKKYNNVSYIQYINSKRIKAAERLLIDPNLSVTEVAMRAGFASLTTFNRAFKKAKNCTPTEFKTLYKISDQT